VLYDTLWHLDLTGLDMMLSPAKLSQGSDTDHWINLADPVCGSAEEWLSCGTCSQQVVYLPAAALPDNDPGQSAYRYVSSTS